MVETCPRTSYKAIAIVVSAWSVWMAWTNTAAAQAEAATKSADRIAALLAIWEGQRSEIATAYFKFRMIRTGGEALAPRSRDDVHRVLASIDLLERPGELKNLYNQLSAVPYDHAAWPIMEIYFDGQKSKEVYRSHGSLDQPASRVLAFDGEFEAHFNSASNQADVFAGRSVIAMMDLSQFRFTPNFGAEEITLVDQPNGGVLLTQLTDKFDNNVLADETNGFVYSTIARRKSGEVVIEVIQSGPVTFAGGIVLPTLTVLLKYLGGKLQDLELILMDEARLNVELPADTFTIAVPKGTTIVDATADARNPQVYKSSDDVPDVVEFVKQKKMPNDHRPNGGLFILLLGVAVGIGLVILVARMSRREVKPG